MSIGLVGVGISFPAFFRSLSLTLLLPVFLCESALKNVVDGPRGGLRSIARPSSKAIATVIRQRVGPADHEKNLPDNLAPHPFIQAGRDLVAEHRQLLHPCVALDRDNQPMAVEPDGPRVARDGLSHHFVPGFPDPEIVEIALESESGNDIGQHCRDRTRAATP